jgi:hypothetical protein
MKKVFVMSFVSLCFAVIAVVLWPGPAWAPPPFVTNLQQQIDDLKAENAAPKRDLCNSINNSFSGADEDPRFRDNCDGTVSDRDTGLMWEKKVAGDSGSCLEDDKLHSVSGKCNWSDATGAWITKVNNTCNNDPSVDCTAGGDTDCINAGVGGECGFAGYRDWRVPEVGQDGGTAELETILLESFPCSTSPCINPIFGPTFFNYWSATTDATNPDNAWRVRFRDGSVFSVTKNDGISVRAVR